MKIMLANDTRGSVPGEHWGSWLTTTNLETLLANTGSSVCDRLPLGKLQPMDHIWTRIEKAGALVINGEGSVHSHTRTAVALLQAVKTANERGIPVSIVNHGCWNCDELLRLYDHADFVAVRDIDSHDYLARHGITAELAADCCFLSVPAKARRENCLLVCSGLRPPDEQLISRWAKGLQCSTVVLSNDFYPRFPATAAAKTCSAADCFKLFATARFVISSSYHGCVFAAIHRVPFLPVQFPGQPPKTLVCAVEAMGGTHAHGVCLEGPVYVRNNYTEIQETMRRHVKSLARRAMLNVPRGRTH